VELTERKDQLVIIFVGYHPKKDCKNKRQEPENEIVPLQKHEVECFPSELEVIIVDPHGNCQAGKPHAVRMRLVRNIIGYLPCFNQESANATNAPVVRPRRSVPSAQPFSNGKLSEYRLTQQGCDAGRIRSKLRVSMRPG
jgi:hypothetical protein